MTQFISNLPMFVVCIFVCVAKITEISIQSVKTVMLVKGQRLKAAFLAFTECVVWGLVISSIISTLGDNLYLLFFYCFGYACGLYLGSIIEGKIAIGTTSIQLITDEKHTEIITDYLTEHGNGYTIFEGNGSKGKKNMILIVLKRKDVKRVMKDIKEISDGKGFSIVSDVNKFTGGYGIRK